MINIAKYLKPIFKNGDIYCNKCKEVRLQLTDDYRVVIHKGTCQRYTAFVKRCHICNTKHQYFIKSDLSDSQRCTFDDSEIQVIKEQT
ncbi:MAG: hypothetical protein RSC24_06405 [Clostridium sp.]